MQEPSRRHKPEANTFEEGLAALPAEGSLDLREYLAIIWHGRWIVLTCMLFALVLGAFQLKKATPVYSASAVVKFEPAVKKVVDFGELGDPKGQIDEIKTQIEVIRSPKIAGRVIDSLNLYTAPGVSSADSPIDRISAWLRSAKNSVSRSLVSYDPVQLDPEVAQRQRKLELLLENIEVAQLGDTKLIQVVAYDGVPARAARIAEEFCLQYIESINEERTAEYRYARHWLEEQIEATAEKLDHAEAELQKFLDDYGIDVMEQNYQIALETMSGLTRERESERNIISKLQAENVAAGSGELRAVLLGQDNRYNKMTDRLRQLELERISMIAENTPSHPEVRRLTNEITVLNDQITSAVAVMLNETQARQALAEIRMDAIEQRVAEQVALLREVETHRQGYKIQERKVQSIRAVFESLLDRSRQLDVTSNFDSSNVTIISRPRIPEYPSSPKIMRTIALFLLLGATLGFGIVMLSNYVDRSIKDPRRVEALLGLPTLGFVPFLKADVLTLFGKKRPDRARLVADQNPMSHEAESFRILRTSIQYSSAGSPPSVLLVSSCLPKEGKSTVAVNLAVSYASRGDKVLLIDADLKLPVIQKVFEIPREPGLSDVLTGQRDESAAIVSTSVENLDVMTAGPATPSPADLLESPTMEDLLGRLREQYKAIIIDSAPLGGMADSLVLSRAVDGVCIVVNMGKTPMDALQKVVATLHQMGSRPLGIVYNVRNRRTPSWQYGPAYGYVYGEDSRKETFG